MINSIGGTIMVKTETSSLSILSKAMADAVEKTGPFTVLVNARRRLPASGIVYQPDLILTADHVVERDEDISIIPADGVEISATVAGRDPGSDLALLRLKNPLSLAATPLGTETRIGQFVLALGRPSPEGIQASLGVISAIGGPVRTWRGGMLERYLRTDAIPYPGFSGGPLIDANGEILGLNTSGLTRGAALSIPITFAWKIAENLREHGHIRRGYLGIRSQLVPLPTAQQKALGREQSHGLLLVNIEENSPAEKSDLIVGDILVAIGGQPLYDPEDLSLRLSGATIGKPIPIEVLRAGQPTTITVTIGERK
jgi:S1-C subfamily serine protease